MCRGRGITSVGPFSHTACSVEKIKCEIIFFNIICLHLLCAKSTASQSDHIKKMKWKWFLSCKNTQWGTQILPLQIFHSGNLPLHVEVYMSNFACGSLHVEFSIWSFAGGNLQVELCMWSFAHGSFAREILHMELYMWNSACGILSQKSHGYGFLPVCVLWCLVRSPLVANILLKFHIAKFTWVWFLSCVHSAMFSETTSSCILLVTKFTWVWFLRTHTVEKPYPCGFCNKKYTMLSSLTEHCRNAHRRGTIPRWILQWEIYNQW